MQLRKTRLIEKQHTESQIADKQFADGLSAPILPTHLLATQTIDQQVMATKFPVCLLPRLLLRGNFPSAVRNHTDAGTLDTDKSPTHWMTLAPRRSLLKLKSWTTRFWPASFRITFAIGWAAILSVLIHSVSGNLCSATCVPQLPYQTQSAPRTFGDSQTQTQPLATANQSLQLPRPDTSHQLNHLLGSPTTTDVAPVLPQAKLRLPTFPLPEVTESEPNQVEQNQSGQYQNRSVSQPLATRNPSTNFSANQSFPNRSTSSTGLSNLGSHSQQQRLEPNTQRAQRYAAAIASTGPTPWNSQSSPGAERFTQTAYLSPETNQVSPAPATLIDNDPLETPLPGPSKTRDKSETTPLQGLPVNANRLLQTGTALAIVLALLFVFFWVSKKAVPKSMQALPLEMIEVLGNAPLSTKQHLRLVRLGNRLLLLAVSENQSQTLSEITDPDEVQHLLELCQSKRPNSVSQSFQSVLREGEREKAVGFLGSQQNRLMNSESVATLRRPNPSSQQNRTADAQATNGLSPNSSNRQSRASVRPVSKHVFEA